MISSSSNISSKKFRKFNSYNFSISDFMNSFNSFYEDDYPILLKYWRTLNGSISSSIIDNLNSLKKDLKKLKQTFLKIRKNDDTIDVFELLEYITEVSNFLDYIKILPRYLGTSTNNVDVFEEPVIEYVIAEGDTLESISKKFYNNYEDFEKIMDYNDIRYYEVNSSSWVGKVIKVPVTVSLPESIEGIIDGHIGKNVLGKDINKKIVFEENDLTTVIEEECFKQGIMNIIFSPIGSVPSNFKLGNKAAKIIGLGLGNLSIPFIVSNFKSVLMLEPCLKKVNVDNIDVEQDSISIEFSFVSILDSKIKYNYNTGDK